jgi:hypothetical protein
MQDPGTVEEGISYDICDGVLVISPEINHNAFCFASRSSDAIGVRAFQKLPPPAF